MSRYRKFTTMCCAAVFALGLAACGGGGGSSSSGPDTTPQPPPKSALSYGADLDKSVETLTTLAGAVDADGSALMMAMKYSGMIGTLTSDGDSAAAMMNAAAVLKAKSDLEAAIMAAKTDKMEAEGARANADDDVKRVLQRSIDAATTQIEAAQAILDATGDDSLASYVQMVTGDDEDNMMNADDKGMAVAKAVAMALGPQVAAGGTNPANGAGLRVAHGTTAPPATVAAANKYSATSGDPKSMTWEQIVGADNVMMMRIATSATDTDDVKAASFAGMAASAHTSLTPTGGVDSGPTYADGFQTDNTGSYMGIPGTIFCAGDDCKVEGEAGSEKLTGSWYFTPGTGAALTTLYMKAAGATTYTADTMFATYGHWLTMVDHDNDTATPDVAQVNTFATSTVTEAGSWDAADPSATDAGLRAASAIYSGTAAGRSVHKTLNADGGIENIQSGRFMADVTLTAQFGGATSMLGGTIYNFRAPEGSNPGAVDSSWSVTLKDATVTSGAVAATVPDTPGGTTEASGQDGTWSATSYGAAGSRPAGIYGGFNAHFTDGHVAGAYATRKE